jgi:hypothetical protein
LRAYRHRHGTRKARRALKVQDAIFKGDMLRTGANASLGITFDDETTFNLSANASITVDEFIYEGGGKNNSALFKIARGTVAFAANQVAKTGDMKIETPSSILGIRGTSGVVEVPAGATPGTAGEVAVKLYQDEDGRVGRIELFRPGRWPAARAADASSERICAACRRGRTLCRRGADDLSSAGRTRSWLRAARIRRAQHWPADGHPAAQSADAGPPAWAAATRSAAEQSAPAEPAGTAAAGQQQPGALPNQRSGQPNRLGVQPGAPSGTNPQRQNLQRPNLQRPPSVLTPRQPARRGPPARPTGKRPPPQ